MRKWLRKLRWKWALSRAWSRADRYTECGMAYTTEHRLVMGTIFALEESGEMLGWIKYEDRTVWEEPGPGL